jgi:hypothetical protein
LEVIPNPFMAVTRQLWNIFNYLEIYLARIQLRLQKLFALTYLFYEQHVANSISKSLLQLSLARDDTL